MSQPTVLLVDDDEAMCQMLASWLTKHGFEACFRVNGVEAIDLLGSREVDVVITDINMEQLNGLELCERVAGMQPDVPVVVITAFGSLESAIGAIRAGAYDYLTKPFEMEELVLVVNRAANHRALRQEVKRLRQIVEETQRLGLMIGESRPMKKLYD